MLLTAKLVCFKRVIACYLCTNSISFNFTTQCYWSFRPVFWIQKEINVPHLPIDFLYFALLEVAFYCHLYGQKYQPANTTTYLLPHVLCSAHRSPTAVWAKQRRWNRIISHNEKRRQTPMTDVCLPCWLMLFNVSTPPCCYPACV